MRIAIFGTGGVGGYFGAKLARGGNDVAFVARGAHLAAMRANGLRVESAGGDIVVPKVVATDDPSSLAPVDAVMFCVKLWDVEEAARHMAPLLAPGGVVIPFQNGIDSPGILRRVVGDAHVLGGVAYIAAAIGAPGVIVHTGSMARLRIGAFDARLTDRARAFVHDCTAAGIAAEFADDITRAIWEKFVFLGALSGLTCLARQPLGVVRGDAELRATFEAAVRETIAVATTKGVEFPQDFPDRQLRALDGLPAEMRSSMLGDLVAGHRLEAPWLCGRVAALAAEAGIAAPVNATIYAGLKPYVDGAPH
ncbi:MAG TPA: 2-dehydropantoate 2-reductase [Casimicrobiaceae bacterium]|nr:2-dehydropantoate 2-reductase [Casimicrobiaceae bacterium]